MTTPNPTPPMGAGDHLVEAKTALAGGAHQTAIAHALIAIAEQGQPVEYAIDLAELERQQRPVILTPQQITRAGAFLRHWADDQLGVTDLSVGYTEQTARALIQRVNEADL